jgi:ribosomal protein L37AE/L43A
MDEYDGTLGNSPYVNPQKPVCESCGRTLRVTRSESHWFCDVCLWKLSRTIREEFMEINRKGGLR